MFNLMRAPSDHQRSRGLNELHRAILFGSPSQAEAVASSGSVDVNQGDPEGRTPLMCACIKGNPPVVKMLLARGADPTLADDGGVTALHVACQTGKLAVADMLLGAGAGVNAADATGATPLNDASQNGQTRVIRRLIGAGANVNNRLHDGATPLYLCCGKGEVAGVRELLRARADPGLAAGSFVPLDTAAQDGHTGVVRELVGVVGIDGCGGESRGAQALRLAAEEGHAEILRILIGAGVVDTWAAALSGAAEYGREVSVRLLVRRQEKEDGPVGLKAYVNDRDPLGVTPLISSIQSSRLRIARMLLDAGADTESTYRVTTHSGLVRFSGTPLALVTGYVDDRMVQGAPATKRQLDRLKAIRRLLLRTEAVHAVSWLWACAPRTAPAAATGATGAAADATAVAAEGTAPVNPTPLALILPVLRRRAQDPGVLLAGLFRYTRKS